ncbi:PBP1A family penicillin-binding protein [Alicyclobacillus sp. SO9]|nr:PBP1A family penicillin-binding protein [Alicyclobacillus sp. SO9]
MNPSLPKPKHWWKHSKVRNWIVFPLLAGFAGAAVIITSLRITPLPSVGLIDPTVLDDAAGNELAEWTIRGSHSEQVPLTDIPLSLQQATIAVEDRQFYRHHAFNVTSIGRALAVDFLHHNIVEGGSTITQQLAKNLYLNQQRTVVRKLKEALYAMQLELHESKHTILTQYLNLVYFGHGAYGVQAASELYFHKPVSELNLAQSAMLAGLPKGPELYSPFRNLTAAKNRQYDVLQSMVRGRYITQNEADKAFRQPLHLSHVHDPLQKAPYFTATAIREMQQRFHISPDYLYRGDWHVQTTLDPVLQKAAERAVASTLPKQGDLQAALIAMDPKTGAIKAMVGGKEFDKSPYNRVFAQRQPGSTFKGVLYTSALEHGWSPAKRINSEMTTFLYDNGKTYTVHDYGDFYAHRPLTLKEAIARSDNVYAVTANLEVGPDEVIQTARKMGLTTPLKPYPAMALGVFPTSPLQLAAAYSVLANGGNTVDPYTISQITSPSLKQPLNATREHQNVVSPDVAFEMSDLLRSVTEPGGTAYRARKYLHGPVAAKTGTTNTDAWTVGYTPNLVCAVWVGYDNNKPLSMTEAHLATPIWGKFMGTAQQRDPAKWYTAPPQLVERTIDPATGKLATSACRDRETDYFVKGTEPTDSCPLHPVIESSEKNHWFSLFPGLFHGTH